MEDAIRRFLAELEEQGKSGHTVEVYHWRLKRFERWCQDSGVDYRRATYQDLQRFAEWLAREGIQPQSRRLTITAVRRFYDYLAQRGEVPANPVPRGLR